MMVYPMKTCRQSNKVDCGVFVLHFIDEFVGFKGTDKEQFSRVIWKIPLDVKEKREEISNTLKGRKESTYRPCFLHYPLQIYFFQIQCKKTQMLIQVKPAITVVRYLMRKTPVSSLLACNQPLFKR